MKNADTAWRLRVALSAFFILPSALLSCAQRPITLPPALQGNTAVAQLHEGILADTDGAGVRRGVWGVAVYSLDRQERLFELNSRALLVPASAAKVASVATASEAAGWNYRYV